MKKIIVAGMAFVCGFLSPFVVAAEQPIEVVTTIFPLYDWLQIIGGEQVRVRQLLPPGTDPHSYAPRPSDIQALQKADLFVFLHKDLEPWAADLLAGSIRPGLRIIEAAKNLTVHEKHEEHHHMDPHVWLDPLLAARMVRELAATLAEIEPTHARYFENRAAEYSAQLHALDGWIRNELSSCKKRVVFFAGHSAFSYFAERYGLAIESPFAGFSPSATPSPQTLARFIDALKKSGATVVFHEELVDPRIARTVAEETSARMELLHSAHNLTAEERARRLSYLDIMRSNLAKLKGALNCP